MIQKLILPTLFLILASGLARTQPEPLSVQAAQQTAGYSYLQSYQTINYTDTDGNIQRLEYDEGVWRPYQLTQDGSAAGDPIPFSNGTPHLVFRDTNGNLQLLFQTGGRWNQRQITQNSSERAKSDPSIYEFGTIHIIYQGQDDQLHEILLDDTELTHYVTTGGENQKAAGRPLGFVRNGEQNIIYRLQDNNLNWMNYNGSEWIHTQITTTDSSLAAGDPTLHFWGTQHIVYRGFDDQLHELVLDDTSWTPYQLTFGVSQQATGGVIGFNTPFDSNAQVIVYRGIEGRLNTINFDGDGWNFNAFELTFAPAAAADSRFSVHSDGAYHLLYRGDDNRLNELVLNSEGWQHYQPIYQETGSVSGTPTGYQHKATYPAPPTVPLRTFAKLKGIEIGPAVNRFAFDTDPRYKPVLAEQFNIVTSENILKFGPVHPEPDVYNFSDSDNLVQFAEDNEMTMRGHALVWHIQQPEWLESGTWTREELITELENHISTVVGRYAGRIKYWDVVNEAIEDGNGQLRETFWHETIGPDYLDIAFRAARAADPNALLIYNDYANSEINQKSDAMYDLIVGMQSRGVPIDGVGLQLHVSIDSPPNLDSVRENMDRFAELGLLVQFTEIDVRILNKFDARPNKRIEQAELYRDLLQLCIDHPACHTFQMWGFTDAHTWIYDFFGGDYPFEAPLPFDPDYKPKPAYYGLIDALAPNGSTAYLPMIR